MKNHLKQSSSCIILGNDIKKELDSMHYFRDQHNWKLSSEMILTLTQCKPINSKYILQCLEKYSLSYKVNSSSL